MDNLFGSGISIGKLAAFLDGNLSASEMQHVSKIIEDDTLLQKFVEASDFIDDDIAIEDYSVLPEELATTDFDLPNPENFSVDGDIFEENNHLYQQGESRFSLVDKIFDELDNETTDDGEMTELNLDEDLNIDDNDMDNDLLDIDI